MQNTEKMVKFNMFSWNKERIPAAIVVLSLAIIGGSLALYVAIDLRNTFGLGDAVNRHFFWHWYAEGGPIEMLQYLSLGIATLLFSLNAGMAIGRNRTEFRFSILVGFAMCLMLIEDAGDPRHEIRQWVEFLFSEGHYGVAGTLTELTYFGLLAAILIYALVVYGSTLRGRFESQIFFVIGFAAYGVAVSLSFVGSAFAALFDQNAYVLMGGFLVEVSLTLSDGKLGDYWPPESQAHIAFHLMDGMVEESIELLGAMSFLAASLSLLLVRFRMIADVT